MAEHAMNQSDDAGKGTLEVGNILGGGQYFSPWHVMEVI